MNPISPFSPFVLIFTNVCKYANRIIYKPPQPNLHLAQFTTRNTAMASCHTFSKNKLNSMHDQLRNWRDTQQHHPKFNLYWNFLLLVLLSAQNGSESRPLCPYLTSRTGTRFSSHRHHHLDYPHQSDMLFCIRWKEKVGVLNHSGGKFTFLPFFLEMVRVGSVQAEKLDTSESAIAQRNYGNDYFMFIYAAVTPNTDREDRFLSQSRWKWRK